MSANPSGTPAAASVNSHDATGEASKPTPKPPPDVDPAKPAVVPSGAKNSEVQTLPASAITPNGPTVVPQTSAAVGAVHGGVGATKSNVGASQSGVGSTQSNATATGQTKVVAKADVDAKVADTARLQQQQQQQQQRLTVENSQDALRSNAATLDSGLQTSGLQARKKSSFQITNVVTSKDSESKDLDATDDADDANTDEMSSDVLESSSRLNYDRLSSTDTLHSPLPDAVVSGHGVATATPADTALIATPSKTAASATAALVTSTPGKDAQSRFKIVKIESKGHLKRGRWVCFDFADPHGSTAATVAKSDVANGPVSGGTGAVAPDAIYYFPNVDVHHAKSPFAPAAIVYNEGHPVLERNPLESPHFFKQTHFFRGDEWESMRTMVAGPAAAAAGVTSTAGGAESGGTVVARERDPSLPRLADPRLHGGVGSSAELGESGSYPLAEQLGGMLSPRVGNDFFSMLSAKRGSQGSPLFAAMVSGAGPGAGAAGGAGAVGNMDERLVGSESRC